MIVPKHLEMEIVNGYCTAKCDMCSISNWTREPKIMTKDEFNKILEKFLKYTDEIEYLTFVGCGEVLLDKKINEKVEVAKKHNFRNVGIVTNCTELSIEMSKKLSESGLDTIICSIDGIDSNTHEKIRKGTNYNKVIDNVENFIKIRNKSNNKTKIIIRFVRQKSNYEQWEDFYLMWKVKLNQEYGDDVTKIDMHNWASDKDNKSSSRNFNKIVCKEIFHRQVIYANGDVGLCCLDYNNKVKLGNVFKEDPLNIFNNEVFRKYRKKMINGEISKLNMCKDCDLPLVRDCNLNQGIVI